MRLVTLSLCLFSLLLHGCATTGESFVYVDEDARARAKLLTQLGVGYMREGRLEVAMDRLERAVDVDSRYAPAHNGLALLKERLGQNDDVEDHYQRAVTLDPDYSAARTNYGRFLCLTDRPDDAFAQFKAAVENPLYEAPELAHYNAGLCMMRNENFDGAEAHFRRALTINERMAPSLIAMSDLSLRRERDLSARAYLQRYLEVGDHTPKTLWLGVQIERRLGDRNAESSYAMLLRSKYPDSPETARLMKSPTQ